MTVLGCDQEPQSAEQPSAEPPAAEPVAEEEEKPTIKLANEPFLIGPADQYRETGLDQRFHATHGVWLVSDGRKLVALSAMCTHLGCATEWDDSAKLFNCPCHRSRFTLDGINGEDDKAKRPLERCALNVVDTDDGPQVQVDPTRRYREDKDQWSDPAASLPLAST